MAIVVENTQTAEQSGSVSTTMTISSGSPPAGRLLIMVNTNTNSSTRKLITPYPTGWNFLGEDGGGNQRQIFWNFTGASEPSTYDWILFDAFTSVGAVMVELSGAEDPAISPLLFGIAGIASTGVVTCPSLTATSDGSAWLVFGNGSSYNSNSWTHPGSPFTNVNDFNTVAVWPEGHTSSSSIKTVNSGATGTTDFSFTPTWHGGETGTSILIAPASSGIQVLRRRRQSAGLAF